MENPEINSNNFQLYLTIKLFLRINVHGATNLISIKTESLKLQINEYLNYKIAIF